MAKKYVIRKRGDQWCLLDSEGERTLGCHDTREEAEAQERAIQARQHMEIRDVEVFRVGVHNGDLYTVEDLDAMVAAAESVGFRPPVKAGHAEDSGAPALGWVENLRRVGKKLLADLVDLPRTVYEAIRNRRYDRVSAEIYWDFETNGQVYPRVLKALALLGAEIPAVTDLQPLREVVHTAHRAVRVYDLPKEAGGMAKDAKDDPKVLTITTEQMKSICPPCAEKMAAQAISAVKFPRGPDGAYQLEGMPPQLLEGLCEKFGPDEGFHTRCTAGISDEITDPEAFCAALHKACVGTWPAEQKAGAKTHQEEQVLPRRKPPRGDWAVVQRGEQWCVQAGEDEATAECFDTQEQAEARLAEIKGASASTRQKEHSAELPFAITVPAAVCQEWCAMGPADREAWLRQRQLYDAAWAETMNRACGCADAVALSTDASKTLRAELTAARGRIAAMEAAERARAVEVKAATVKLPALRRHVHALYETILSAPRTVKFAAAEGDAQVDVPAEAVVDSLVATVNAVVEPLFREHATVDATRRAAALENPRDEADRRAKEYIREHSLHPVNDYKKALDAVLAADEELKKAYAHS